jgi:hypothetical protein
MNIDSMTKDERSMLLYAESCAVDGSGLLVGQRMNAADMEALKKFKAAGLLDYGRIPARLITAGVRGITDTHWVTLTESGWNLAHLLRRKRALQLGPKRREIDQVLAERQEAATAA